MNVSCFKHARLAAVATAVPAESISLMDELEYYDNSPEKARRMIEISGFATRRVAPEGVTAADLCCHAAQDILKETDRAEIDALIFLSESPDYPVPATAAILQHRLGLGKHCAAFDMRAACSGYIHALWTAAGLIESRACRKILICAGNATARHYDPANRIIAPLFGDAGTATVLEYCEDNSPMSFSLGNDGSLAELFMVPGGGARIPPERKDGPESPYNSIIKDASGNPWTLGGYGQCWMNGMDLFRAVVAVIPAHIKRHLQEVDKSLEEMTGLVLHQGNRLMVETIARVLKMPLQKAPWATLTRYGNQMCASLPAVLCDQFRSELENTESSSLLLCGFGAGFSWGSCLLQVSNVLCPGIRDYSAREPAQSRTELIARWHAIFRGEQK